jgi:hypothetical protein
VGNGGTGQLGFGHVCIGKGEREERRRHSCGKRDRQRRGRNRWERRGGAGKGVSNNIFMARKVDKMSGKLGKKG